MLIYWIASIKILLFESSYFLFLVWLFKKWIIPWDADSFHLLFTSLRLHIWGSATKSSPGHLIYFWDDSASSNYAFSHELSKTCWILYVNRYDIQTGIHDTYEDCVSVMRLYKRMRAQEHRTEEGLGRSPSFSVDDTAFDPWRMYSSCKHNGFWDWSMEELKEMSPDELYKISRSGYQCWCLDSKRISDSSEGSLDHIWFSWRWRSLWVIHRQQEIG